MIKIIGGTYNEKCFFPKWDQTFGSGLRAAVALSKLTKLELFTLVGRNEKAHLDYTSKFYKIKINYKKRNKTVTFHYFHSLSTPVSVFEVEPQADLFNISSENILMYGMVEGSSLVNASRIVYDPQSPNNPELFTENGSTAKEIVLVINQHEAQILFELKSINTSTIKVVQKFIKSNRNIKAVIIKMGSRGGIGILKESNFDIPVYETNNVWLVGSGDVFSAVFGYYWMEERKSIKESAMLASLSTAYYCDMMTLPIPPNLNSFYKPKEIHLKKKKSSNKIYLAGPFFNMQQLWIINESLNAFSKEGVELFSPYHDVGTFPKVHFEEIAKKDLSGVKKCGLMFAILDGLDAGTIFEIGYARSLDIPVVCLVQNEKKSNMTMILGSGCEIYNDLPTAVYKSIWRYLS